MESKHAVIVVWNSHETSANIFDTYEEAEKEFSKYTKDDCFAVYLTRVRVSKDFTT